MARIFRAMIFRMEWIYRMKALNPFYLFIVERIFPASQVLILGSACNGYCLNCDSWDWNDGQDFRSHDFWDGMDIQDEGTRAPLFFFGDRIFLALQLFILGSACIVLLHGLKTRASLSTDVQL